MLLVLAGPHPCTCHTQAAAGACEPFGRPRRRSFPAGQPSTFLLPALCSQRETIPIPAGRRVLLRWLTTRLGAVHERNMSLGDLHPNPLNGGVLASHTRALMFLYSASSLEAYDQFTQLVASSLASRPYAARLPASRSRVARMGTF